MLHWSNTGQPTPMLLHTGKANNSTLVAHASDESMEFATSEPVSHSVAVDDAVDTAVTVAPTHAEQHIHTTTQQQQAATVVQHVDTPPTPTSIKEQILSSKLLTGAVGAGAAFLGGTFLIALVRVFRKYNSPKEKRRRTVDKNKVCGLAERVGVYTW